MQWNHFFAGEKNRCGLKGVLVVALVLLASAVHAAIVSFGSFPNNSTHSSASVMTAIANVPANSGVVYDPIGQTNYLQVYNFGTLVYTGSVNVNATLQRIRLGYWMPTETDDGGFFNFNNAGELPNIPRKGNNYYMEFVVWPFLNLTNATYDTGQKAYGTVAYPGPMRLLIGLGGEVWFTGDHYGEDGLQLNAENVNPPPPAGVFKLSSVAMKGSNMFIAWNTIGGETNVVQAASGILGSSSNHFVDISPNIVAAGGDLTSASYLDVGGATNFPARFYRVRLVQ
jgi:ribonuclease